MQPDCKCGHSGNSHWNYGCSQCGCQRFEVEGAIARTTQTEIEQKEHDKVFYQKGIEDGKNMASRRITIQLANEFHGNGYPHSWVAPLNWYHSRKRVRAFLDQLWQEYGPTYEED